MKKIFLLLVLAGTMTTMMGQHARLNFYGAYTFDDGFDVVSDANTYYNGTVKGGVQWGAGLHICLIIRVVQNFCTYTEALLFLPILSLGPAIPNLKHSISNMILYC